MPQRMKIAIVHPSLAVEGGAQNVVVWLAWGLRQRGHEVAVFTTDYDASLWPAKFTDGLSVSLLRQPVAVLNSSWLRLRHFAKVLRRLLPGFDVVNCHNPPTNLWVARAASESTSPSSTSSTDSSRWRSCGSLRAATGKANGCPTHGASMAPVCGNVSRVPFVLVLLLVLDSPLGICGEKQDRARARARATRTTSMLARTGAILTRCP